jgi:hypothetical protein
VTIRLRDGREFKGAADANRGDDQDPYSREELAEKFLERAGRAWPPAAARNLHDKLHRLDELRDLGVLSRKSLAPEQAAVVSVAFHLT